MCSFTDPEDQDWGNFVMATEFEPLRMMLLTILLDTEVQMSVNGYFPLDKVAENIHPGQCLVNNWHATRRSRA